MWLLIILNMLIAVTGTPGVGKTTLSKMISSDFKLKHIDFEGLLIENKLYIEYDESSGSYVIDADRARDYFNSLSFEDAVLDGHNVILIYPCEKIDYVILLRCSPYVLYDRMKRKGYADNKIIENIQAEILDIVASDVYNNCEVRKVMEIDVSEGVDRKYPLVKKFLRGDFPEGYRERVDWLSLVADKGDLNRFMRSL